MANDENVSGENGFATTIVPNSSSTSSVKSVRFSNDELIPPTDNIVQTSTIDNDAQAAIAALPSIPMPAEENGSKFKRKNLPRAPTPLPKEFGRLFSTWDDDDDEDDEDQLDHFQGNEQQSLQLPSSNTTSQFSNQQTQTSDVTDTAVDQTQIDA